MPHHDGSGAGSFARQGPQGGQAALRALKFRLSAGPFFCFAYSAFHAGISARAREISRMARSASGTSVLFVAKQITNGSRA